MAKPKLTDDRRTVTVRVPISIGRRGGRKLVLAPDGRTSEQCLLPGTSIAPWSRQSRVRFGGVKCWRTESAQVSSRGLRPPGHEVLAP